MSRDRQTRDTRQQEEQKRIESEISLLERRLTSLRLQVQVHQREKERQTQQECLQRQNHLTNKLGDEEPRFVIGDRVQVTNQRDDLYG